MKIKCASCETVYSTGNRICPACSARGGFLQDPKSKEIGNINVHLEDILNHKVSKNKYQVKEIQNNGLIALLVSSPMVHENVKSGLKVYISNETISEYSL